LWHRYGMEANEYLDGPRFAKERVLGVLIAAALQRLQRTTGRVSNPIIDDDHNRSGVRSAASSTGGAAIRSKTTRHLLSDFR
jgi:hypothetical protein